MTTTSTSPRDQGWPALNWPLVICGYFALQAVWRRLLGGGLTLDEAEMLLWSRHLAWGYGSQPPLYSWVQWAVFQIVPDTLLALSLLKNLLLAGLYLAVYRLLRAAHPSSVAGPAALCVFLLPQVSWESQRDLTHSVLVTTMAAITTLVFWSITLTGRRFGWLAFGVAVGLGLLAKANFVVVPLALGLAAASLPELRHRLSLRGIAAALLVCAAMIGMPVRWALTNPDLSLSSVEKLGVSGGPNLAAALAGLRGFAEASAGLLALAAVVLGATYVFCRPYPRRPPLRPGLLDRFLLRLVCISLGLVGAAIVLAGMTDVRDRWLITAVYLIPPLAAIRVMNARGPRAARVLVRTVAVLAAVVVVALAVHFRYGRPGNPSLTRAPVAALAEELSARHPEAALIVAEPAWLAGNLLYQRPHLPVVSARNPGPAPADGALALAVWWNGDRSEFVTGALAARWGKPVVLGPAERLSFPFPIQPGQSFDVDAAEVAR